jgi:hypothetical protein
MRWEAQISSIVEDGGASRPTASMGTRGRWLATRRKLESASDDQPLGPEFESGRYDSVKAYDDE